MPSNPGDPRDNGSLLSGDLGGGGERATFRVPGLYRGIADVHPALRVDGWL
jgi:hypothetical protein